MNTTHPAKRRPPTAPSTRSDPESCHATAVARSAKSDEPSIDDRDALTIITPPAPPRVGPLTARVLLKILLDAAQRAGDEHRTTLTNPRQHRPRNDHEIRLRQTSEHQ